jgi:hypothetical protein
MGKGIDGKKLVKRWEKLSFMEVKGTTGKSTFERMEGFTDITFSKNPKEYSRQYVDEESERTDISGYSESISYTFNRYNKQPVAEEIVEITENEYTGTNAVRRIITVDKTTAAGDETGTIRATARIRPYTIVPDSNGGSTDCLTYSGNFKSNGTMEEISIQTTDNWQTVTIVSNG